MTLSFWNLYSRAKWIRMRSARLSKRRESKEAKMWRLSSQIWPAIKRGGCYDSLVSITFAFGYKLLLMIWCVDNFCFWILVIADDLMYPDQSVQHYPSLQLVSSDRWRQGLGTGAYSQSFVSIIKNWFFDIMASLTPTRFCKFQTWRRESSSLWSPATTTALSLQTRRCSFGTW